MDDGKLAGYFQRHIDVCKQQVEQLKSAITTCELTIGAAQDIVTRISKRQRSPERKTNIIECAEVVGECMYWGTSDGKCYTRKGNKEKVLFAFERKTDKAFIAIKHITKETVAIACLPDGEPTIFIFSPDEPLRKLDCQFLPHTMCEFNNNILVASSSTVLKVCDIHSGKTIIEYKLSRPFMSFTTDFFSIYVSFHDEFLNFQGYDDILGVFVNTDYEESIPLPPISPFSDSYTFQGSTGGEYLFTKLVIDYSTRENVIVPSPTSIYSVVQPSGNDSYGLDVDGHVCEWMYPGWKRCNVEGEYKHLIRHRQDVYGVTDTDIHKLTL